MNRQRIWALILRYFYSMRDMTKLFEILFWPLFDIGLFGLIALWGGILANEPNLVKLFVTGLVLWQIVFRSHFEICLNMMDEFTDQNLINLVASPLKMSEWIAAMMLSGLLKITFTLFFGASVGFLFFKVNIFTLGVFLIPLIVLCILSGWMIGFVGASFTLISGAKIQQLAWVIIMLSSLLGTVFFPLSILPSWLAFLAKSLPMSYIFESMRQFLQEGTIAFPFLIKSFILSLLYLILAIKLFLLMFERGRKRGWGRLI